MSSAFFISPSRFRSTAGVPSSSSSFVSPRTKSTLFANPAKKKMDKNKRGRNGGGSGRPPSKVVDWDGPTPDVSQIEIPSIDPDQVPGLQDIRNEADLPRPIPHQSWRRGDTAGCEAPIAAPWRREAEEIIRKAALLVGGNVLDVTWYLTAVVVTLDNEGLYHEEGRIPDLTKSKGPPIDIVERQRANYKDPSDPNPPDIDYYPDEILYQRETEEEAQSSQDRKKMNFAKKDADDDPDEPHIPLEAADPDVGLYMNEETRPDVVLRYAEEELERYEEQEKPINLDTITLDSAAISTIAHAILEALEEREEELQILSRHELILTSPGASDVLDTQRQFDAYRGFDVIVETQDPFDSNRTLKGKLVDRNSMDLIINKKGRMVTIPLNFVKCVRLPPAKREKGVPRDAPF